VDENPREPPAGDDLGGEITVGAWLPGAPPAPQSDSADAAVPVAADTTTGVVAQILRVLRAPFRRS